MWRSFQKTLITLILLPAAVFTLAACFSKAEPVKKESSVTKTSTGAFVVNTVSSSATVTGIDAANRNVTLTASDGTKTTVKCGPEVRNFNQIKMKDRVNVVYTEELAVFLGGGSQPDAATAVALAPVGAKPGAVTAQTVQITAKVTSIDLATRKVTLQLPDGAWKTVTAGEQIDLVNVKLGDTVTARYTEAVAITVETP
jgi:Cu/Ag efflux protein CusF